MKDFYGFASEHPFLTFFLFAIVFDCISDCFKAIAGIFKRRS